MFFQTSCAHAWVIHYTTTVLRTGGTPVYILSAVESPPAIWNYVARNEVGMDSLRLLMEAAGYGCPLSCSPSTEHFAYWRCRAKSNRRILKCCGPNIITNFWITFLFNTCICYKVSTSNGVRSIQVQGVPEYVGKVEFEIKKKKNAIYVHVTFHLKTSSVKCDILKLFLILVDIIWWNFGQYFLIWKFFRLCQAMPIKFFV